jgi:hypothetical protein
MRCVTSPPKVTQGDARQLLEGPHIASLRHLRHPPIGVARCRDAADPALPSGADWPVSRRPARRRKGKETAGVAVLRCGPFLRKEGAGRPFFFKGAGRTFEVAACDFRSRARRCGICRSSARGAVVFVGSFGLRCGICRQERHFARVLQRRAARIASLLQSCSSRSAEDISDACR